jgi:hypothetical protein
MYAIGNFLRAAHWPQLCANPFLPIIGSALVANCTPGTPYEASLGQRNCLIIINFLLSFSSLIPDRHSSWPQRTLRAWRFWLAAQQSQTIGVSRPQPNHVSASSAASRNGQLSFHTFSGCTCTSVGGFDTSWSTWRRSTISKLREAPSIPPLCLSRNWFHKFVLLVVRSVRES